MAENEPVYIKVPLGDCSDVALIGALDYVVCHFQQNNPLRQLSSDEVRRAVEWLADKYGRTPGGGES